MSQPANGHCLIVLDVGSSSIKAAAFDPAGRSTATASRPVHTYSPQADSVIQDPRRMAHDAIAAIAEVVLKAGPDVRDGAIAVTGQMGGVVVVNRKLRPLTPWLSTLDTRSARAADSLMTEVGHTILDRNRAAPFMASKLRWLRENGGLQREGVALLIGPYVAAALCGSVRACIIDRTSLTWTGMADIARSTWDEELVAAAGWSTDALPAIVEPGFVVGGIDRAASRVTGLPMGFPVIAGPGDQAASLSAIQLTSPGRIADTAATFPMLVMTVSGLDQARACSGIDVMAGVDLGRWHLLSYMLGTGALPSWWGEHFWPGVESAMFDHMDAAARAIEVGANGLVAVPHFSGRGSPPDSTMKGGLIGLSWSHRPEHVYRAFLEGIAYEYRHLLRLLSSTGGVPVGPVVAFGGGAHSALLSQIKADVLGLEYRRVMRGDLTTLGTARLVARLLGWHLPPLARVNARHIPRQQIHRRYQMLADRYDALLDAWGYLT